MSVGRQIIPAPIADGGMVAVWTPEHRADTPLWCVEPRRVGATLWCKHVLSAADWWNVYTDGLGDGTDCV